MNYSDIIIEIQTEGTLEDQNGLAVAELIEAGVIENDLDGWSLTIDWWDRFDNFIKSKELRLKMGAGDLQRLREAI